MPEPRFSLFQFEGLPRLAISSVQILREKIAAEECMRFPLMGRLMSGFQTATSQWIDRIANFTSAHY
jgi:hypothetical protein